MPLFLASSHDWLSYLNFGFQSFNFITTQFFRTNCNKMIFLWLFCCYLASGVVSSPVSDERQNLAVSYSYAVDIKQVASQTQFACLKSSGSGVAFIRGYKPDGDGSFDSNCINNIKMAYQAGVGTEVYMTPQPVSKKYGFDQADELYKELKKNGITVKTVWVQVTSPVNWSNNTLNNCAFINEILSRSRLNGLSVGIYTNYYDWKQITGGWTQAGTDVMLWYWNVFGSGSNGESPANFSDFVPFAGFTNPIVKQFGQAETMCSLTVNRDVFSSSSTANMAISAGSTGPVVGGIGLH